MVFLQSSSKFSHQQELRTNEFKNHAPHLSGLEPFLQILAIARALVGRHRSRRRRRRCLEIGVEGRQQPGGMARDTHDGFLALFKPFQESVDPFAQLGLCLPAVWVEEDVLLVREKRKIHHGKLARLLGGRTALVAEVDTRLLPNHFVGHKRHLADQLTKGDDPRLEGPAIRRQDHQLWFFGLDHRPYERLQQSRLFASLGSQWSVSDFRHDIRIVGVAGTILPLSSLLLRQIGHKVVESLAVPNKVNVLDDVVAAATTDRGNGWIVHRVGFYNEGTRLHVFRSLVHSFHVFFVVVFRVGECRFAVFVDFFHRKILIIMDSRMAFYRHRRILFLQISG
mmetsp:Transcript_26242/g.61671  ORF Transcript_26242/g.61671 Transcript_26242/m.61671 type:complete len:338 (+) Transcript_26242:122-1135(+)